MISWALSSKTSWQLRRAHTGTKRYLTSRFIAVIKHQDPKQLGEENLSFSSASHSLREVVTGTELELETGGRSRHRVHGGVLLAELCSVACSSLLSYTLHDHVPRVDTTHHVLGLRHQSQRKSPTGLPTDQPRGTIFSKFSP